MHYTDNRAVVAVVQKGSSVKELQEMALHLFKVCRDNKTRLQVRWLSRKDPRMEEADAASRLFDLNDWGIGDGDLARVQAYFGGVTFFVDLFASEKNTRAPRFFSLLPSTRALGQDAFAYDWPKYGFAWCCPPVSRIIAALRHLVSCKARGLLCIPVWKSASFWPFIAPDGKHVANYVEKALAFHPFMRSGKDVHSRTFCGYTSFKMLVLQVDGGAVQPFAPSQMLLPSET